MTGWQPVEETQSDVIAPFAARALAATLDRIEDFAPGTPLPPLWHWSHALRVYPMAQAGEDGHQALGHLMPPLPFPRRMWAGGRLTFHAPLRIGDTVTRRSVVTQVVQKQGRSGPAAFVTLRHVWHVGDALVIEEEQDVVYRAADALQAPGTQAPETGPLCRQVVMGSVALFRYSALTFNGHRIHYDRDFCAHEGYGGLVVHGPLLATLLLDLLRIEGGRWPHRFEFRATAPVLADTRFTLNARIDGDSARLWVRRADGALAMQATAQLA